MSEPTIWTSINFPVTALENLWVIKALKDEYLAEPEYQDDFIVSFGIQTAEGTFEILTKTLIEQGIPFDLSHGRDYGFSEIYRHYRPAADGIPEVDAIFHCDGDGNPILRVTDLRTALKIPEEPARNQKLQELLNEADPEVTCLTEWIKTHDWMKMHPVLSAESYTSSNAATVLN